MKIIIYNHIFIKIKSEGVFIGALDIKNKSKSYVILKVKNNYLNLNLDEYEFKLNGSQKMIENKLIVPKKIKKNKEKNILKYKATEYQKIEREMVDPEFIERSKNNLNNIIAFPKNKIIKSGLLSLKEKIPKKRSQKELPINSYIKKPNDEKFHQVSNSNPKIIKKYSILKHNSLKNANNLLKTSNKRSLFETNEIIKKVKTKFINHNQIHIKIMDSLDKNINNNANKKIFSGSRKIKKTNKIKKNVIIKNNKIDINDEILLDITNNNKKYSIKIN